MRMGSKKAFGIDIGKNAVSFVQLQKNGRQIKVVRAGCVPLEPAIMSDGVVQDPAALARVLKQLKIAETFANNDTVLTICAEPVLLQILNLPDSSPGEVRKFIQNEIRQYAVLPLKNIEMDYCGLRSSNAQAKRVLVGAAQSEHLSLAVKAIEKDNINVKAVEPAITAFIRACYDKVIKPAGEKNIMLLLIRDDVLNLCVYEKQKLEFLRTKKFEADIAASGQRSKWLKDEIESVVRFYELEKEAKEQNWQVFIACCPENQYSVQIAGEIRDRLLRQDVEIAAFENSLMDLAIEGCDNEQISPVAAGAAMKLLDENKSTIELNLLPKEIVSIKKSRKEKLIIANVAVCLFFLLFLQIAFLGRKSVEVNRDIGTARQKHFLVRMIGLVESKRNINRKTRLAANNLASISKIIEDKSWYNWSELLTELANITPQTVLIKKLQTENDNRIKIDGFAVNFEAVNGFVGLLEQSRKISSASLISAGQDTKPGGGLIDYSIVCCLTVSDLGSTPSRDGKE